MMKIHKKRVPFDKLWWVVKNYKSPKLEEFQEDLRTAHRRKTNVAKSKKRVGV